jgi:hypothetical protein
MKTLGVTAAIIRLPGFVPADRGVRAVHVDGRLGTSTRISCRGAFSQ